MTAPEKRATDEAQNRLYGLLQLLCLQMATKSSSSDIFDERYLFAGSLT